MGHNVRFRGLHDASHYGADFAIICRACGREVVIERQTLITIVQCWKLSTDRETLSARLRCTACRKRGCRLEYAPQGTPHALRLADGMLTPPRGVSISQWLKSSRDQQLEQLAEMRRADEEREATRRASRAAPKW